MRQYDDQTTRSNSLRRTYNIAALGSFAVVGASAFTILLVLHRTVATALIVGLSCGAVPQGLGWGVAELLAPGWVIRWRQSLISGTTDYRKAVGDYFSDRFAITGSEPWKSPVARKRVRLLGALLTAIWLAIVAVLVWLPPYLDAFFMR